VLNRVEELPGFAAYSFKCRDLLFVVWGNGVPLSKEIHHSVWTTEMLDDVDSVQF
jgi:hypothetical protein